MKKLEQIRNENGLTQQQIASKLGMNVRTYQNKINNLSCFTLAELEKLIEALPINAYLSQGKLIIERRQTNDK